MQRALAGCAQELIRHTSGEADEREALATVIGLLREGMQALQAGLFENYRCLEHGLSARPVSVVNAPGALPLHNNISDYQIRWSLFAEAQLAALQAGEPLTGSVDQLFLHSLQPVMHARHADANTLLLFAIKDGEAWWGCLAFNDRAGRSWNRQEVLLLQSVATLIGAFLVRNREVAVLREREALLSSLSDNLHDALVYQLEELPGGEVRRTYLSRGLEQRSGISAEQALADIKILPVLMHPDDVPGYEAARHASRQEIALYEYEHRYIAADGSIRWLHSRSSPRRLNDGRLVWDGVSIDTTDYRQLQEALRQANLSLNRRVDELSLLNRITQLLSGVSSLPETLELVCRLLKGAFSATEVVVALRERSRGALKVIAHATDQGDQIAQLDALDEVMARLADHPGTALIEDESDPAHLILSIALHAHDTMIGLLQIHIDRRIHYLNPDMVSLAQTIASSIASATATIQHYEHALHNSERLERLNSASRMINGAGLDLPKLYIAIHCAVAHLMPVESFVISLVEGDSPVVESVYSYDERFPAHVQGNGSFRPYRQPVEQSFTGFLRHYGTALRVDDFLEFYAHHPEVGFDVFGSGEDTRSGLAASFLTADGLYGMLFAQCYPPGVYNDDDLTILELLAAHAATAIENARRAQQHRRDAIDEERNRLARDLHDSVSQSLFAASLIAERLPAMARINSAEAHEGQEQLRQLVRGALTEMRALLVELRPAALTAVALDQALDQLVRAFSGRRAIPIGMSLDPVPKLLPTVQLALYRIVQECLSNIIKHAQARSADVQMSVSPPAPIAEEPWTGTITIRIADDGRGFQPDQIGISHFGIGIMRERAAAIGARFELISRPGIGTKVEIVWSGSTTHKDRL